MCASPRRRRRRRARGRGRGRQKRRKRGRKRRRKTTTSGYSWRRRARFDIVPTCGARLAERSICLPPDSALFSADKVDSQAHAFSVLIPTNNRCALHTVLFTARRGARAARGFLGRLGDLVLAARVAMLQVVRRVSGRVCFRRHARDEAFLELAPFRTRATGLFRLASLRHFVAVDLTGGKSVHGEKETEAEKVPEKETELERVVVVVVPGRRC
mmetsp:Transcript_108692/g.316235  ORF Transcript_108692/g.316235 Transcript_108692/m.316235 type:complete len:214 (+) Transcript_108692:2-643(+)